MAGARLAGCIAADGRDALAPLGGVSAVRRAVIALQQAGAFPVAVTCDPDDAELRAHLANRGVVFLLHPESPAQLFDSVKLGFSFLAPLCDYIAFAPVDAPTFSAETVLGLMDVCEQVAQPSCQGRAGHPVVVSANAVPRILGYEGPDGLRGAVRSLEGRRWLDVGACQQSAELVRPVLHVRLERDEPFFDDRTKLLLFLVDRTGNMRRSCELMALSYAKGWGLVNELEGALGYPVVERRRGGAAGGATRLTERGRAFLDAYLRFERRLLRESRAAFSDELAALM